MITASRDFEDVSKKNHNTDSKAGKAPMKSLRFWRVTGKPHVSEETRPKRQNFMNKTTLSKSSRQNKDKGQTQNCHVVQNLTGATR